MAQKRGRIGAVPAVAVECRTPRLGREADHHAEIVLGRSLDRHLRRAARLGKTAGGNRHRLCFRRLLQADARRERIVAAGIEQQDRHRHDLAQPPQHVRQRHQPPGGIIEGRKIGIGRHQPVLAAGLDAVAGIVEHGDVGILGILDEALEIALQLRRIAVGARHRIEAEIGQKLLDGVGVVLRIGEFGQRLIGAIADDQRHAAQIRRGGR